MFTGIIRDLGDVIDVQLKPDHSMQISIKTNLSLEFLSKGASVCCNGCCLTVVSSLEKDNVRYFSLDLGPKTLDVTHFSKIKKGDKINLEPALRMSDFLGGHFISGHVDSLATVEKIEKFKNTNNQVEGGFYLLRISIDEKFKNYIFKKSSISIKGVSLTISDIAQKENILYLDVMLIPETLRMTNLVYLEAGQKVEVEFDYFLKSIAEVLKNMLPMFLKSNVEGFN